MRTGPVTAASTTPPRRHRGEPRSTPAPWPAHPGLTVYTLLARTPLEWVRASSVPRTRTPAGTAQRKPRTRRGCPSPRHRVLILVAGCYVGLDGQASCRGAWVCRAGLPGCPRRRAWFRQTRRVWYRRCRRVCCCPWSGAFRSGGALAGGAGGPGWIAWSVGFGSAAGAAAHRLGQLCGAWPQPHEHWGGGLGWAGWVGGVIWPDMAQLLVVVATVMVVGPQVWLPMWRQSQRGSSSVNVWPHTWR